MTDLERRALLGDRQAQEECTKLGIVIPCWKCCGKAEVNELHTGGKPLYAVACQKHYCGAYGAGSSSIQKAIEFWNTRPAPPIGRCRECGAYTSEGPGVGHCNDGTGKTDDGYCDYFYPKGGKKWNST